ncbi:MAG TPA: UDP-N-acetylmuramoyl-tripeptide--D-alanyl-D-alanine ligase [Candidatus Acidoferrales bacterium]|nr:UDP-N-acetylmuramoyl-tripeptide--D-alanyl-D-alanine ligase [Candidatus Acidoferrales bacterium]
MQWTIEQVARALGAEIPAGLAPMARLAGVSIDSRTVGSGELFFAIHGPRHDGHGFVAAALEAGATAAVVTRERFADYSPEIRRKLFAVPETLSALQRLAHEIRTAWGGRVAAVAGSVGKTTTKEILAALVAARFRVLKTEGNLNNEYGLPLTLARLEEQYEAAVLELGMSHSGELAALTKISTPEIGVVTRVAVEHLEFFASIDEIAAAERELVENLPGADTLAVLNADDARVLAFAKAAPGRVITFGVNNENADYRATQIESRGVLGSAFTIASAEGDARVELSLAGKHNVANAIGAFAAASVWGISSEDAARVLPTMKPAAMRGEILRLDDGLIVINDCYNSSPSAMTTMLDLLAATPGARRRILAAGEMLELGESSAQLHREVGRDAAKRGLDWIIGVRGHASEMIEGAIAAGYPAKRTKVFSDSAEAAKFLSEFAQPGDLILVKGSRGVRMERIVEAIAATRGGVPAGAAQEHH